MKCVICGSETRVTNSRKTAAGQQTWRRRRCEQCLAVFTTKERVDLASIAQIARNETLVPYSRSKLFASILAASGHLSNAPEAAEALTDTIETKLTKELKRNPTIPFLTLQTITLKTLKAFNPLVYTSYLAQQSAHLSAAELARRLKLKT